MAEKTLADAFIDEVRDTFDAERQLTKALPKMAKAASSLELKAAFTTHLEETRGQIARLEKVFELLDEKARGKHCAGMAGIIEEGSDVMEEDLDDATMDACLIASGNRAEHYEMAAYGTLVAWARELGHMEVAELLQESLNEEKNADQILTTLGQDGINAAAASGADADDADDVDDDAEEPVATSAKSGRSNGTGASARSAKSRAR